ncbi:MAG TPA: hypothetical protein PKC21_10000 [Oligoflexia bacterium]|nr:hypothetical protein [Oligoflexia bacterium]HMR25672.1 hypothetical protein [Oligoflexia bacterium]
MKHWIYSIVIASMIFLAQAELFAQRRVYAPKKMFAQGTFLVKPKNQSSQGSYKISALEQKAMAKASRNYQAKALSAHLLSKKGSLYIFKVKLRKSGKIFSKTVEVRD